MRSIVAALALACPLLVAAELPPQPLAVAVPLSSPAESGDPTDPPLPAEVEAAAEAEAETETETEGLEVIATLQGQASFYAKRFHGRRTASGELHDAEDLTAAHRSLPFGTWVQVQSLHSGQQVTVRINDRGPFTRGRVIDLSRAAAEALGMLQAGTHAVRVQVLGLPKP